MDSLPGQKKSGRCKDVAVSGGWTVLQTHLGRGSLTEVGAYLRGGCI